MAFCTACGTQLPGGAFCPQCGTSVRGSQARTDYQPSTAWLAVAGIAWLVTDVMLVAASLRSENRGSAYAVGVFIGSAIFSLLIPAVVRLAYVAIFHRGPELSKRALASPWLWAIGTALNALALLGRSHPHN